MAQMRTTPVFERLFHAWQQHPRYISSCGGARSSKTVSALELLLWLASRDKPGEVTSVVSETFPHLKRGAMRDFEMLMGRSLKDIPGWNASTSTYTLTNGAILEFFSADAVSKVHGPQRKRLFVNEAININREILRQLAIRTSDIILLDYNPTHASYIQNEIEARPDCISIHSTYRDNPFLSPAQIAEIEANRADKNWWRVYGEGKTGQLEGLVFPEFEQIDTLPETGDLREAYGLDFGFTNDPSVLLHTLTDTARKIIYLDECFYRRGMLNADLAAAMSAEGVPQRSVPVYADCAEPKTIAELAGYGFNVLPCYKATRKAEQLQALRGYSLRPTKRSTNTIRELRSYTWARDREGNWLNEPIAYNDHAMDALRYAIITPMANGGSGNYSFGYGRDYTR